ncbi:MAG: hypothetical protein H6653_09420 [Ardenticatenaceae bacterium]|nr:hypothetical protein [Ardenticatenaceae bacterium]
MLNLEVWGNRLKAVLNSIKNDSLVQLYAQEVPRKDTLIYLLEGLHDFGQTHFSYFYEAFTGKTIDGGDASGRAEKLEKDNEFSSATVLNWITAQISDDLSIILRAWNQRRDNQSYKDVLDKADKFAQLALCPAVKCGYIPAETAVLCYFQKSYRVRLMPYANVVLVGVPFSALDVPRDFLAIPHEVAHFVFRHGTLAKEEPKADGGTRKSYKSDNESIASFLMWELRNKDRYLRNWIEEIFADMYGCVIAGPVIALDFQDLQMDDRLEEFADATIDHEDPPPLIRPDTYSKVLAKSTDFQRSRLAELLHHRWKLYRNTLWNNYRSIYLIDQPDDIEPILKIGRNAPNRTAGNRNVAASIQNQPNTANSENIVRVSDIREDNLSLSDSSFDAMITIIWKKFIFNVWEEVKGSKSECHDLLYLAGDIADQEGEEVFLSKLLAGKTIQDFPNDEEKRNELDTELNKLYENFKTALNVMIAKIILKEATPSGIAASDEERNNKWVAWQNRWEKRNVLKRPSPNVGLLGSNPKPLTGDDVAESRRPETEWGWVILAYANGWVTRGPEPNPTGD